MQTEPRADEALSKNDLSDNDSPLDLDETVESKLERCQQIVGHRFNDPGLLLSALTHASYATHRLASNERLEFLVTASWVWSFANGCTKIIRTTAKAI